jgi:phage terminase small subunit
MTELQNRRHELFAQGLVEGKTAAQAYEDAGYTSNRCNASRLKTNENIVRRVTQLRDEHRKRHDVTVDDLLDEYDENRKVAFELSQISAANGATIGKARLLGYDRGKSV